MNEDRLWCANLHVYTYVCTYVCMYAVIFVVTERVHVYCIVCMCTRNKSELDTNALTVMYTLVVI